MAGVVTDLLSGRREPALWFHTVDMPQSLSRSGGLPSLPAGVEWPVNTINNLPLHFMAQIDLGALPPTPLPDCPFAAALPRAGMLFFFFSFAEYWDHDYHEADERGLPHQSRVIYTHAAGPDRTAPPNLPKVGYTPGEVDGGATENSPVLPLQHRRAYAIETIWETGKTNSNGKPTKPVHDPQVFKFEAIERAVGEPAPLYPSWDAVPSPPPSYYSFISNTGRRNMLSHMQTFGAELNWQNPGEWPRDRTRALLLELLIDAHEIGTLQYWISMKDLNALNFDQVYGDALFT